MRPTPRSEKARKDGRHPLKPRIHKRSRAACLQCDTLPATRCLRPEVRPSRRQSAESRSWRECAPNTAQCRHQMRRGLAPFASGGQANASTEQATSPRPSVAPPDSDASSRTAAGTRPSSSLARRSDDKTLQAGHAPCLVNQHRLLAVAGVRNSLVNLSQRTSWCDAAARTSAAWAVTAASGQRKRASHHRQGGEATKAQEGASPIESSMLPRPAPRGAPPVSAQSLERGSGAH